MHVGVTSDEMARAGKAHAGKMPGWEERTAKVREYFGRRGALGRVKFSVLDGICGPEALEKEAGAIVVSPETLANAKRINELREERGVPPLEIHVVGFKLAYDDRRISSERIRAGEIKRDGRLQETKS